jgi:UPF0755 protein
VRFLIAIGLFFLLLAGGSLALYGSIREKHPVPSVRLTIPQGEPQRLTLRRLGEGGFLRGSFFFRILSHVSFLPPFQSGTYRFSEPLSDLEVIRKLTRGEIELVRVTIPEGVTAEEIAGVLERAEIVRAEGFLLATRSPRILERFSIPATEAEGYLFPDTYFFPVNARAEVVVERMIANFFSHLPTDIVPRAERVGLTLHQAVILASIIQKETYLPEEMPYVSAVFHNRLSRGVRLQADPTAIYRMPGYSGNLTRLHLATYTPYNTYVIRGLPRGPIGNPGLSALESAVNPAPVDYLYFVADGQGRHLFSRSYREHLQYVNRYQRRRPIR